MFHLVGLYGSNVGTLLHSSKLPRASSHPLYATRDAIIKINAVHGYNQVENTDSESIGNFESDKVDKVFWRP